MNFYKKIAGLLLIILAISCTGTLTMTRPAADQEAALSLQGAPTKAVTTMIEAESYSAMSGIELETCSEGGQNVGWIDAGDWIAYGVYDFPVSGEYTFTYRVASLNGGGVLTLDLNAGSIVLGSVNIDATGGWQSWTTVSHTVTIDAGSHSIGIYASAGGWNLNYLTFSYESTNTETLVEAENYSEMSGIDVETCSEGGQNVGWTDAGDWMAYYDYDFPSTGNYTFSYRVASLNGGGVLSLDLDAGAIDLGSVNIDATGGWQSWTTVSHTVYIDAGSHNIGIYVTAGGWNLNYLTYTYVGGGNPTPTPTTQTTTPTPTTSGNVDALSVSSGRLNKVLKGMSSHGLHWFGQFMNASSIQWLRDDWGANVVRAAMYTGEGGYITDPSVKSKVYEIVDAAISLNMYVIIDWHILSDNNPQTYQSQAIAFFQEMAAAYGSYPNVIYEICNEPNGAVTWSANIKPYAEAVIPAIRAIDPDNVIIVGTGTWSQDVHDAADNQLAYNNIMYAVHFYAGTHGQYLRDRIDYAMGKGAAVFVTEWGTSDASGSGGVYPTETAQWLDFMNSRGISWCNWSLCDKNESSAALWPGANTTGGWPDSQISTSGLIVKDAM